MSSTSKTVRDLIIRGSMAAKAESIDEARYLLEKALMINPSPDQCAEIHFWLSKISADPAEKRNQLEEALSWNPSYHLARRELSLLDGRLKADEIIDPDRIPTAAPQEQPQRSQTRRFVCRQCGGQMAFVPGGKELTCAYCDRQLSIYQAIQDGAMETDAVDEQDFGAALATAKGHTRPVTIRSIKCQGCGACFVLSPEMLTSSCPYCASGYVVEQAQVQELIPPKGVVPFGLDQKQARRAVGLWLKSKDLDNRVQLTAPTGVYFPVWTFDVVGEIPWKYQEKRDDTWVSRSGVKAVYEDDMLVPASRTLPASLTQELIKVMGESRLDETVPYDPAYLADWPAETYEIPVSNASLVARQRVFKDMKRQVTYGAFGPTRNVQVSSNRLVIESFKLLLLPLWIVHYRTKQDKGKSQERKVYTIVVNGQTGAVRGETPPNVLRKLWSWLKGEE